MTVAVAGEWSFRCDHCNEPARIRVDSDAPQQRRRTDRATRSLWLCPDHARAIACELTVALREAGES